MDRVKKTNRNGSLLGPGLAIRDAIEDDAQPISDLMIDSAREFFADDFSEAGMAHFMDDCGVAVLENRIRAGDHYYVAVIDDVIAGVCAIRRGNHLYSLFTDSAFHRRGVARSLWERALQDIRDSGYEEVTVKASNYAVPAYERLGFVRIGPGEEESGIVSNPMLYKLGSERNLI